MRQVTLSRRLPGKFCLLIFPSTSQGARLRPQVRNQIAQDHKSERMGTWLVSLATPGSPAPFSKWNLPAKDFKNPPVQLNLFPTASRSWMNSQITLSSAFPIPIKTEKEKKIKYGQTNLWGRKQGNNYVKCIRRWALYYKNQFILYCGCWGSCRKTTHLLEGCRGGSWGLFFFFGNQIPLLQLYWLSVSEW